MTSRGCSPAGVRRRGRTVREAAALGIAALLLVVADHGARAGSGSVNNDGTIDISVSLRFPPTAAQMTNIQNLFTAASQVLWDATEGQLWFDDVTFTCGSVNEDLADYWFFPDNLRSGVSYFFNGSGLGTPGYHINQYAPNSTGIVIAHEFGHLGLGLGDEYDEQNRFGACWGHGPCIEAANLTEQNQCLMQQPGGFTQSELCTAAGHDTVLGQGTPCTAAGASAPPCATNCQFWSAATLRYETTQQTANVNRDCWTHVVSNFPFLAAPAGLPVAAPPAGMPAITFTDNCFSTSTVLLLLDRSGSMAWHPNDDWGEVCANGADDDGDGSTDEMADCANPRITFVRAAARAWLALVQDQGVRAGVVSFDDLPNIEVNIDAVTAGTIGNMNNRIDLLAPGGLTAIGRALSTGATLLGPEAGTNRTLFLISDGVNTAGETPESVIPAVQAAGIRVFTVSTGEASNDTTLTNVSGQTMGQSVDSASATQLVNAFVQQYANYQNEGVLLPLYPYQTNAEGRRQVDEQKRNAQYWAEFADRAPVEGPDTYAQSNRFEFTVEDGTERISLALAGDLNRMEGFGVHATLDGPGGEHFDSDVADPALRVVTDPYFLLLELEGPAPGQWTLTVAPAPGADAVQTGNATVIIRNPRTDLFVSVDRRVVEDPSEPVELRVLPRYGTELYGLEQLTAAVLLPDGSAEPIALETDYEAGGGGGYRGVITTLPYSGVYEVRVYMRTGAGTINHPGEPIFDGDPATVPVPLIERTATVAFTVVHAPFYCPRDNQRDCDGDCVLGESEEEDLDRDGRPDAYDPDADGDELPDGVEARGCEPADFDRDDLPNHLDPDADGDDVPDTVDNCYATGNPDQADHDEDGHGDDCDNCPDKPNPGQGDADRDGLGDDCDPDPGPVAEPVPDASGAEVADTGGGGGPICKECAVGESPFTPRSAAGALLVLLALVAFVATRRRRGGGSAVG